MAANALLPARGGDGVKAVLARTSIEGSTLPTIAATMVVTALFDGVLGLLPWPSPGPREVRPGP